MNPSNFISFVREKYAVDQDFIPLHDPRFVGKEREYLMDAMDSNFVSSVGAYVGKFEQLCAQYTGAKYAVATMNGTAALHVALMLSGVKANEEVITQPLTFIATANAISYMGAQAVFVDVDKETMGLSPAKLRFFLEEYAEVKNGKTYNKSSGRRIAAVVPMHTFGHPCRIVEIAAICEQYHLALVEDAAESLGSRYKGKHTGLFGKVGILSFNGNKIITSGGGGMILTDDEELAATAKSITTTAKIPHAWEFKHSCIAYNYRLTNLAAALGCAQMENLDYFVQEKRKLAKEYEAFFKNQSDVIFWTEPQDAHSNYWLNAILLNKEKERDQFLAFTNEHKVMTRPIWTLMNKLPMFAHCQTGDLSNALYFESRVVNIPSSVFIPHYFQKTPPTR